jgi:hypothetical protein
MNTTRSRYVGTLVSSEKKRDYILNLCNGGVEKLNTTETGLRLRLRDKTKAPVHFVTHCK